jgi:hypothetical protein
MFLVLNLSCVLFIVYNRMFAVPLVLAALLAVENACDYTKLYSNALVNVHFVPVALFSALNCCEYTILYSVTMLSSINSSRQEVQTRARASNLQ